MIMLCFFISVSFFKAEYKPKHTASDDLNRS
nr:MAG TPA_asm: hypothetical protein [Caudoviricetes sp.]